MDGGYCIAWSENLIDWVPTGKAVWPGEKPRTPTRPITEPPFSFPVAAKPQKQFPFNNDDAFMRAAFL